MTQPIWSNVSNNSIGTQRLMELIEAEDAANGEVGCGIESDRFLGYLYHRSHHQLEESLRVLLREHLGHILTEYDMEDIANQVHRYAETLIVNKNTTSPSQKINLEIVEHIPEPQIQNLLQVELGEYLPETSIRQVLDYTRIAIHKTVLQPRHTWAQPIWVLRGSVKLYVVQAANLDDAIATTREQHPQDTLLLEVVKVGGVLAPNQVIAIEHADV